MNLECMYIASNGCYTEHVVRRGEKTRIGRRRRRLNISYPYVSLDVLGAILSEIS